MNAKELKKLEQELERVALKLTGKQTKFLSATIQGKTLLESQKAAGYNKPPRDLNLLKCIELFKKYNLHANLHNQSIVSEYQELVESAKELIKSNAKLIQALEKR